MKIPAVTFALLPLLSACTPPNENITLGAPATQALKTTDLASDGNQRLKTLATQTSLTNNAVFSGYRKQNSASWNNGWTRSIDFSGVSWDHKQAGTAITPRHVVFAAHYPLKVGTTMTFHDRAGNAHKRKIIKRSSLLKRAAGDRSDILVALLDTPLPPSIKTYRLLPPRPDYEHALLGVPVLITEQNRRVYIHQVKRVTDRAITFGKNPNYPDALYKHLIKGDSSNPAFILVGGEPVLVETHSGGGGGNGAFYSAPAVFKALQESVAQLDSRYRIRTVPLDPQLAPAPANKKVASSTSRVQRPAPKSSFSNNGARVPRIPASKTR